LVFAVANFEVSFAREVAVGAGRSSTEQDLGLVFLAVGGTCVDAWTSRPKSAKHWLRRGVQNSSSEREQKSTPVSSSYSVSAKGKLSLVVAASSSVSGVNAGSLSGRAVEGWYVVCAICGVFQLRGGTLTAEGALSGA
jgi:hypothetical protein